MDKKQVYDISIVIASLTNVVEHKVLENQTKGLIKSNIDVLKKLLKENR